MRVYVAGPITKGDTLVNIANAIHAAERLLNAGHAPYVPHLNYTWHMMYPHPHQDWYDLDNEWLPMCEALLRLPGESPGADAEVKLANFLSIPVFHDVDTFLKWSTR